MESEKISLDVREINKLSRFFQLLFSILCFAVSAWFLTKLIETGSMRGSNLIAVLFLLLFGIWELTSGLGMNDRYIIFSESVITLKSKYFGKPVEYRPADISVVAFRTLSFVIIGSDGKRSVIKLGNYYQEKTVNILESLNNFCRRNNIKTEGLEEDTNN